MTVTLRLEPLEPRDVPATFGIPWPDGEHLAPSSAPPGTSVLGVASNLSFALLAHDPDARLAVLRAFQTWSVQANVTVGGVSTVPLSGATPPSAQTARPSGAPVTSARPTSTAIPAPAPAPRGETAPQIPPGASSQPAGVFVPPIRSRTDPGDRVWYMWWY
jgi:hypothetical protein